MSGLHIEQLQSVLKQHQPITVTLGNTGVFESDKHDVVYIEVLGNELHHLHHSLKEALANTQTYPNYKPHITIAYVKPGLGKQYANKLNTLKGREVTLNALTFSDKDRQQVHLPLGNNFLTRDELSQHAEKRTDPNIYYHGSPSGDLRGSHYGLHIGTHEAAKQALTARIGHPVHGSWDGSREYGKTLLAGQKTLKEKGIFPTGHNATAPEHDYYPHQHPKGLPTFSDGNKIDHEHKPNTIRVKIKGEMTNTRHSPHPDFKANGYMKAAIKKGNAKRGYYYKQEGEDVGSISAVVPHHSHLEILDNSQHAEVPNKIKGGKGDGKNISKFDPEQIAKGIKVEMEHTNDPSIALEIAIDHLTEDERYYDKLAKVESSQHAESQLHYPRLENGRGKRVEVLQNPNLREALHKLNSSGTSRAGVKELRHIHNGGNHYFWDASEATHDDVHRALKIPDKNTYHDIHYSPDHLKEHFAGDRSKESDRGIHWKDYSKAFDQLEEIQFHEVGSSVQFSDAVDFNPHRLLAPPGGVTVHGVKYNPGQHIPHQVIQNLHPEHKSRLVAGTIARHIQANPQLAKDQTHGSQEPHQPGHRITGQTQGGELPGSRGVSGSTSKLGTQGTSSAQHSSSLEGLPTRVKIPGYGEIQAKHSDHIREVAKKYMESAKLPYDPPKKYAKVDPERAKRIAAEYHNMKHDPHHPEVKKAYEALATETMAQWEAIKKHGGLKVSFIPHGSPDPYAKSPRLATEDIHNNKHMWVFPTDSGFGSSEADVSHNPLLKETNETISGKRARLNDIFRIVHDYFGHAKEGVGFRADGEENAWRMHSAMYSPLARKAMTTETRGQNSWVNFGPHGETNKKASSEKTVFADQKTGLLPDWVHTEGHHDHDISQHSEEYLENYVDGENQYAERKQYVEGIYHADQVHSPDEQKDFHRIVREHGGKSYTLESGKHLYKLPADHHKISDFHAALEDAGHSKNHHQLEYEHEHALGHVASLHGYKVLDTGNVGKIVKGKMNETSSDDFDIVHMIKPHKGGWALNRWVKGMPLQGVGETLRTKHIKGVTNILNKLHGKPKLTRIRENHQFGEQGGIPFNGGTFQLGEENHEVHEHGKHFKTGVPVTFEYSRNKKPAPNFGERYQQHIEPHGRYMLHKHPSFHNESGDWEHGTVTFKNPLVVPLNTHNHLDPNSHTYDQHSWKANLHSQHKVKGKALSKKLAAMGHDGIVTVGLDPKGKAYDTREIVDLSSFHQHSQHAEHDESEPLPTTLSSQIDTAQVNLLALSNSSLGLTELAVIAQKELDKLKEPLHKHLVIGGLQGAIEGAKETVALIDGLPKDHKEYLSKRYSLPPTIPTLEGSTPLQPPQTPTGGLGTLGGEIPPQIHLPDLEAAVAKLGALPAMVGTDWIETAELVKSGAFAITTDLEQRQVQEIKEILTDAVANGSSQKEFIEEVNNKVFESGDGTLSKAHLENIFRTNALSAKSDAKLKTINSPMVKSAFPYARVSTTEDERRRPTHKAIAEMGLDGTNFYNMDDPFFRKYRGPWWYQCRCTFTGTTVEQASRHGVLEAVEWKQRAEEKANKEGGSYYQYLEDTKPQVFKYVDHPEFQEPSFHDKEGVN